MENKMRKYICVVLLGFMVTGLGTFALAMDMGNMSHDMAVEANATPAKEIQAPAAEVKAVDYGNKVCPVSGEQIVEENKATYEYKGRIYNFCCASCIPAFKSDPEKFIKKMEDEKQAQADKTK